MPISTGMSSDTLVGLWFAIGISLSLSALPGIREDELACEEAFARLKQCCPGLRVVGLDCEYIPGCSQSSYPEISVDQSACIRDLTCEEVTAAAICEQVQLKSGTTVRLSRVCGP